MLTFFTKFVTFWSRRLLTPAAIVSVNIFHAAGVRRQQVQNFPPKKIEFHGYIWNHCEKWIQISTNMPSIGSIFPDIVCVKF